MKKFLISFVTRCPKCRFIKPILLNGMGESHAERYRAYEKEGKILSTQCPGCHRVVDMQMLNVKIEEEGAKR